MSGENNFKDTVNSLFKGMDAFISAKTVVGDAIHVGDTIILPLVDVSFGVGAGAFEGDKKSNGGGGMTGKLTPSAVLVIHGEKAHSRYFSEDAFKRLKGDNKELLIVPGATHTDLYDQTDKIPFDKMADFFHTYLK